MIRRDRRRRYKYVISDSFCSDFIESVDVRVVSRVCLLGYSSSSVSCSWPEGLVNLMVSFNNTMDGISVLLPFKTV